jgi:hypothetical protein
MGGDIPLALPISNLVAPARHVFLLLLIVSTTEQLSRHLVLQLVKARARTRRALIRAEENLLI